MNTSFLVEDDVTVKRRTVGSYSNAGVWTEGTLSTLNIKGCIQPEKQFVIDRSGMKRLQNTGNIILYTSSLLKVMDNNQSGDLITHEGKDYELMDMEHWKGITQEFYKYIGELKNAN